MAESIIYKRDILTIKYDQFSFLEYTQFADNYTFIAGGTPLQAVHLRNLAHLNLLCLDSYCRRACYPRYL